MKITITAPEGEAANYVGAVAVALHMGFTRGHIDARTHWDSEPEIRSVADRLRELEAPVLFSVDMEDGVENYLLTPSGRIIDIDGDTKEGGVGDFEIHHFEDPPESDLTIHYPTQEATS